jgi:fermentation-respiration switch protein FrsA (DUF1100 family)
MSRLVIHVRAGRALPFGSFLGREESLGPALGEILGAAVVDAAGPVPIGQEEVVLRMDRPTPEQAVDEMIAGLERLGYSLVEAEVGEIVDRATQGAVVGLLGGGLLGLSTQDPYIEILAALVGTIAGAWAGSTAEQVVARRHFRWVAGVGLVETVAAPGPGAPGIADGLAAPQLPRLRPTIPRFP